MPLQFGDVEKLIRLMVENKISVIEFDGVKIIKGLHDIPQENKEVKKEITDDEILFNPYKGI